MVVTQISVGQNIVANRLTFAQAATVSNHQPDVRTQYGQMIANGFGVRRANADINQRLMESIEWIGKHSQYLRKATADGVIDQAEREQIEENSYQVMAKWQEHLTLLFRVFCQPEKSDARECAAPGVVADKSTCMEK